MHTGRSRLLVTHNRKKSNDPKFFYPYKIIHLEKKIYRKIHAIFYNCKTAKRLEAGFPLNNRPKRAQNMPG